MNNRLFSLLLLTFTIGSVGALTENDALKRTQKIIRYAFAFNERSYKDQQWIRQEEQIIAHNISKTANATMGFTAAVVDETIRATIPECIADEAKRIVKRAGENEGTQIAIAATMRRLAEEAGTQRYGCLREFAQEGIESQTKEFIQKHNHYCASCQANEPANVLVCGHKLCDRCKFIRHCPKCHAHVTLAHSTHNGSHGGPAVYDDIPTTKPAPSFWELIFGR